ncbi:MAG: MBL fold metallo-hydrolase [Methanobacteriota archaeon]
MKLTWYGQSAFKVVLGGKTVYLDPHRLAGELEPADLILVSHGHWDHCDPDSIKLISEEDTPILAPKAAAEKLSGNVQEVSEKEVVDLDDLTIEVVPAYNTTRPNHPKGSGVGYIIRAEGESVYHAGDTDLIPEMQSLLQITVALLPVGGTYTMDADEAVCAAEAINPKIAIPMHYGEVVGTREDAEEFKTKVEAETQTKVVILEKGGELEL